MSEPLKDDYENQEQWRKDVRTFALAICKHWHWWTCATIGSGIAGLVLLWVTNGGQRMIPGSVLWLFVLCALLGVLVAAFLAFRGQLRSTEAVSRALESKKAEMQELLSTHTSEIRANEWSIQKLRQELDDRAKRKDLANKLGDYHLVLSRRIREIKEMYCFQYAEKYPENFENSTLDPDTTALLEEIKVFLGIFTDKSLVAIYENKTGFQKTDINQSMDWQFRAKEGYWQGALDVTQHKANQLMKIIEKWVEK